MADIASDRDAADARNAILDKLHAAIDDLFRDIELADPSTPEEEHLQLRRHHELGYLANQYRKLDKATELDEMDDRLELLEER